MGDPNNCIVVNLKMKIEHNVFPLHTSFLKRITKKTKFIFQCIFWPPTILLKFLRLPIKVKNESGQTDLKNLKQMNEISILIFSTVSEKIEDSCFARTL